MDSKITLAPSLPIVSPRISYCALPGAAPRQLDASFPRIRCCAAAASYSVNAPLLDISKVSTGFSSSSHEYNQAMKRQMKNPYEYHHELGMYYTRIHDRLIVGSQPQSMEDVDHLVNNEGVSVILNLQQDHDIKYWGIELAPILHRCQQLGVSHYRRPAQDFDGNSLRNELPRIVAVIDRYLSQGKSVYIHCTAGLGRAPGAAIAYLYWFTDMDMHEAYELLTSKRPCGPKKEAIRGATYDLAKDGSWKPPLDHLPDYAFTDLADWERELIRRRVRGMY